MAVFQEGVHPITVSLISQGALASAEARLLQALAEIGITLPSSYAMLLLSLAWHAFCHTLFQVLTHPSWSVMEMC